MGNHDLGVAWLLGMVLDDKRFERAVASCADNITMDLEDAVVAENKEKKRNAENDFNSFLACESAPLSLFGVSLSIS